MSSEKIRQDEELLDQKIARIRKKNEEILRRRQEIEEDKKFAEQQNAMVNLRPSIEDWPRERTPALRPSQRQFNSDGEDQMSYEPVNRNKDRNQPSSRGRETTGKSSAPPPDPVSFLADPERDNTAEKEAQPFTRGTGRNFQDFRRDGPRRGRGSRGRGFYGKQAPFPSSNDNAWREERYRIDEARINRQKSADGKWRREWDNEKINLESHDEPVTPSITPFAAPTGVSSRLDRWKQQPKNFDSEEDYDPSDFKGRGRGFRGGRVSGPGRGRRGVGNYKIYPEHSPPGRSGPPSPNLKGNISKYSSGPSSMTSKESYNLPATNIVSSSSAQRIVTNMGDSYKVVVPNTSSEHTNRGKDSYKHMSRKGKFHQLTPPSERGYRQRLSQSQSSYSEDECQKENSDEQFHGKRFNKLPNNPSANECSTANNKNVVSERGETNETSKLHKPPLPPFRTSLPKNTIRGNSSKEFEDGEESWEDTTSATSGNESVGDDCLSLNPSPRKLESLSSESDCNFSIDSKSNLKDPTDIYTPEDFIHLVPSNVSHNTYITDNDEVSHISVANEEGKISDEVVCSSKNEIENYPPDVYSPDDFIKLVPSDNKSIENVVEVNSTPLSYLPEKEENLNLTVEIKNECDAISKNAADIQSEIISEKIIQETTVVTNKGVTVNESPESLQQMAITNENIAENLNEKILSESDKINAMSVDLKQQL